MHFGMSKRLRSPALGAAAFLVLGALVGTAGAAEPVHNGRIAFALLFETSQLYSVRADGSARDRLTTDGSYSFEAVESPKGRQIAFVRAGTDAPDIYVMNRDGTDVRNLTNDPHSDYDPMW